MIRHERLKDIVWERLQGKPEGQRGFSHLTAVSVISQILALRRGADPDIARTAGLLHDLWLYENYPLEAGQWERHGPMGAELAKQVMDEVGDYDGQFIDAACRMIAEHNDKDEIHDPMSELLKDADAMAHFLNASDYDKKYRDLGRVDGLLKELGI